MLFSIPSSDGIIMVVQNATKNDLVALVILCMKSLQCHQGLSTTNIIIPFEWMTCYDCINLSNCTSSMF